MKDHHIAGLVNAVTAEVGKHVKLGCLRELVSKAVSSYMLTHDLRTDSGVKQNITQNEKGTEMNKFKYWNSHGNAPDALTTGRFFGKVYTLTDLFERTELALGIFPDHKFDLHFWADAEMVQDFYTVKYNRKLTSHSFVSRSSLTAYLSLEDLTPAVFVHEIAHLLLETNLKSKINYNAHEAVAQWAVKEVLG